MGTLFLRSRLTQRLLSSLLPLTLLSLASEGLTQPSRAEIKTLKKQLEELQRRESDTKQQLEELQQRLDRLQSAPAAPSQTPVDPLERALQHVPAPAQAAPPPATPSSALAARRLGGTQFRLIDISVDILAAAGGSSVGDAALQGLQGGGHDPRKNGFTLQNVELSLSGAVDPYFNGETHIAFFVDPLSGETTVELEEAFLTTQSLPLGLQAKAGFFFTEFGLLNPTHPHAWAWLDQSVINARLFGPDGMRQAGGRLGWLVPVPWFAQLYLGAQNAGGETMASFLASAEFFAERGVAGRPFVERGVSNPEDLLYNVRLEQFFNLTPALSAQVGGSAVFGPNASGPRGRTTIYGGDLKVRWRPTTHFRGWPFVLWQTEIMQRDYRADQAELPEVLDADGQPLLLPRRTLHDWGLYTQVLYGFHPGWAAGLRFDYARGSGPSVAGRPEDPFRDTRYRVSPLLAWQPSEFSRLRLQYNYDHAQHLSQREAHSVWLGLEILYGAHPAHKY